jgi:GT2 family glycosyltransferase
MDFRLALDPSLASRRPVGSAAANMTAVICTRNRPAQLSLALGSLCRQDVPPGEILVIDNAPSSDASRRIVREGYPGVRYILEPVQGLNFARNRALREAGQPFVAFLDDDAVAHPGWIAALAAAFEQRPQAGAVTTQVQELSRSTEAQRLFEANGGFSRGERRIVLPRDGALPLHGHRAPLIAWSISIGNGSGWALRREAAAAVGGFDEALDLGEALPGGGDLDLLWRLVSGGWEIVYEPEAKAYHDHRRELAPIAAQLAGHQRALIAFLCKALVTARGKRRWSILAFLLWRLAKPVVRILRGLAGRDPLPLWVLWRMWGETWDGLAAYPMGRALARRRRAAARVR